MTSEKLAAAREGVAIENIIRTADRLARRMNARFVPMPSLRTTTAKDDL